MTNKMPHWLTKQASLAPNKAALQLEDGTTYTFLEMKIKSEKLARQLATLGVKKYTKIAILSPNHAELVFLIHAISYLNAVAVMLNTRLTTRELQYQLENSAASIIITTETLREEKQLVCNKQVTFTEITDVNESDVKLVNEITLTDPYTMMFTSGTTGNPKAVLHTYENHWSSAVASALNLGLQAEDKWLLTLPIFHIGGFSILMRTVIYGITTYLLKKYKSTSVLHVLQNEQITIASLVTLMLQQVIDELGEDDFPETCRCILLGGGSVEEPLLQKVATKQIPLFQSYGMTETSSQIATLNSADASKKLGSAGKALFSAQIKINQPNIDNVGEVYVKGPMVMNGYYENDTANANSFTDGWLKTGDLGYFDEAGFLYIVDRRTDLIISGGENIYPSEIEAVLMELADIKEAVVVGKTDEKWGQVPVAFIVRKGEKLTKEMIIHYSKQQLATFKIPVEINFIEVIPRNATNKIMRHTLKQKM